MEQKDNMMPEDSINRRNALRRLALFPIEIYGLSQAVPTVLRGPEEFLAQCAAGITACWYLRKGKDLAFASDALSRYMPTLKEIVTSGRGTQRKGAAELLAQCLLLKAQCVSYTHADHMVSLRYAEQAEMYSKLAGNTALTIVAIRKQASAYDYVDDWEQAIQAAERAKQMIEGAEDGTVPSFVQSYVHVGLAHYQAHCKLEQEVITSLRLAETAFDASNDEPEPPIWVNFNEANLLLHSGFAYYHLNKSEDAIKSFAKIETHAEVFETTRIESFTSQMMAEVTREDKPRDMGVCIDLWKKGMQGAIALHSEQAFTDAKIAYVAMRAAWPAEQRIKKLSERIVHW
jgi:tetratricopeptide (TPR) repeat protein